MPGAVAGVEIDGGVRVAQHGVGGVVDQADAVVGVGLTAVGGQQRQAVGFDDHDRLVLTEAGDETVDPSLIVVAGGGAAGRILGAVAAGDVVGDEDGDAVLVLGALDDLLNVLLDALGGTFGEPDRLRSVDHGLEEVGLGLVVGFELIDLNDGTVVGLGDIKLGVGI